MMVAAIWRALERRSALIAAIAAIGTAIVGLIWGTYVAGGPDSYCHINQAELFVQGRVRDPQPIVEDAPWPDRVNTAVPVGHVAASRGAIAAVPMCPPGYAASLALARVMGGRAAMFWVVPLFGALGVWCTFLIGRRVAGAAGGLLAAILLATSPAFLYQVVQPMSDVPAAGMWAAALVLALGASSPRRAWLTGVLSGAALFMRPNLAPLGLVMAASVTTHAVAAQPRRRAMARQLVLLASGAIPFLVAVLALQNAMYGGPLSSGYGSFSQLFSFDHVGPNLARYSRWLLETETPFLLIALAAPILLRGHETRRASRWLLAFALTVVACYLPYQVFDAWWFLRFLLPAYPALFVLASAGVTAGIARLSPAPRLAALVVLTAALAGGRLVIAEDRAVFKLRDLERRFRDGGEYVARKLPPNAVVFTTQQSGSVRFYSGRPTVIWDMLDPAWLDRAVEHYQRRGLRPFFLFEHEEDRGFRARFESNSRLGGLEWPPAAQVGREVRIFDPLDYERFRKGEKIETDYVFIDR